MSETARRDRLVALAARALHPEPDGEDEATAAIIIDALIEEGEL